MILGPLLLWLGVVARLGHPFFFPQQLAAFHAFPTQMQTSYSLFLAGNMLLWPAVATLAQLVGRRKPNWALWGGTMVIFGLFARTFHAGIDHLSFQVVRFQNLELATKTIAQSYGAFHIVSALNLVILLGWIVLAIGTFLSGILGLLRSVALGLMAALMMGVLKGSTPVSVLATTGLCLALIPLGIQLLRQPPTPRLGILLIRLVLFLVLLGVLFLLGQAG